MSKGTEYLKEIHRFVKGIMTSDYSLEYRLHELSRYLESATPVYDNNQLRTILVATKAFQDNPIVSDHINKIVNILEERTGKPIV